MKRAAVVGLCVGVVLAGGGCRGRALREARRDEAKKGAAMAANEQGATKRVKGSFDVKMEAMSQPGSDEQVGWMTLEKTYHGAIDGTSRGQMLAHRTGVKGSAGYVALERVVGTLDGRKGSFVLQHSSVMNRGAPTQSIMVVPDSGTDELTGLSGAMTIEIETGEHFYVLEYRIQGATP